MTFSHLKRALAIWLLIILAESIHGTLRTLFLAPLTGDFPARQVSVFTGAAIIFAICWLTMPWLSGKPHTAPNNHGGNPISLSISACLTIGAIWVVLTVLFEITLGRALGLTWQRIIEDYNLAEGGLMGFGLAAMFVTPWLVVKWRNNAFF
jgi:hypothetical protein